MNVTPVTPSASLPLDLAVVKQHVRIFHDEHDLLLSSLIEAVTSHLDGRGGILGRALITQVWDLKLQCFPSGQSMIELPFPPLKEVEFITYLDCQGVEQTVDEAGYQVETGEYFGRIYPVNMTDWPCDVSRQPFPVTVRFTAGYGDGPDNVPPALRQAMLLMIGKLYNCPQDQRKTKLSASDALVEPWRTGGYAL